MAVAMMIPYQWMERAQLQGDRVDHAADDNPAPRSDRRGRVETLVNAALAAYGAATHPRDPMSHAAPSPGTASERPLLPFSHLLKLSIYWFGILTIWGGLGNIILPSRIEDIDKANAGSCWR